MNDSQRPVEDLLSDPKTYGVPRVDRIDTHAASVFLAGDRAFKIKRPVRFPFLDYSSLDKREAACRAELEVNRPYAPQIYRGVLPVTRGADGGLALGGAGEPVEWVIEMRRFDETQTLDRLADGGKFDLTMADKLAREVAKAHANAPVVDAQPWIESLSEIIAQNERELGEHKELFPVKEVVALSDATRHALANVRPVLEERGRLGLIRRCHGDLHLGNVVLIGQDPVLFDAIEFDPLIATGDVLYDLAFLLMDLADRNLPEAANRTFNVYLGQTRRLEDLDALVAMPLFLSLRAAIRAKVTAERLQNVASARREPAARVARQYFAFAQKLIAPTPPKLVAIGGLSGTGKSVLAQSLAAYVPPIPGAVVLRSDVERKALFGKREAEKLTEAAYRPEVTSRVYAALIDKARRVLVAGHSAIVDAVYARPGERAAVAALAKATNAGFYGLFLTAAVKTRIARVSGRRADASDADAEVAQRQEAYDLGAIDWRMVDASGPTTQTLVAARGIVMDKYSDSALHHTDL